ncbi:hypothetical protein GCM10023189_04160 [Nibrella saemangeumensis]|uniref:Frag1/DRAM/Sfk1 family protein n=1 Tax=Nibrella saemangeumensis TaxID=1084526 RepID=A0ABP8ME13_9BACT
MTHEQTTGTDQSFILNRFGYFIAILTTGLTALTFGIALMTPPLSGPFCTEGCYEYPYSDIASRFPRDYLWMYPAILLTLVYLIFMVCVYNYAPRDRKLFGQLGVAFSGIATLTLVADYFIQLSVIQPSLLNGETDGIALLTQYNPHGIFIALEELGYLLMSVSFLFIAFTYSRKDRLEQISRWVLLAGFWLTVLSLALISVTLGIHREYIFELAVISIDWLVLLTIGVLQSILFKKALRKQALTGERDLAPV